MPSKAWVQTLEHAAEAAGVVIDWMHDWPSTQMSGSQWSTVIQMLRQVLHGAGLPPEEADAKTHDIAWELWELEHEAQLDPGVAERARFRLLAETGQITFPEHELRALAERLKGELQ